MIVKHEVMWISFASNNVLTDVISILSHESTYEKFHLISCQSTSKRHPVAMII
jgi:hypothetical protein